MKKRRELMSVVNPLTGENANDAEFLRTDLSKGESVHSSSQDNTSYQRLEQTVLRWMNTLFIQQGIVVRNIGEECNDGILLGRILNMVFKTPFSPAPVLTDANRRQNLEDLFVVLRDIHGLKECDDYNQELLYESSSVAVISLICDLFRSLSRPPFEMPTKNIEVAVVRKEKVNGVSTSRTKKITIKAWDRSAAIEEKKTYMEDEIIYKMYMYAPNEFRRLQSLIVQLVNVLLDQASIATIMDLKDPNILEVVLNMMILRTSNIIPDFKERDLWKRCVHLWKPYLGDAFDEMSGLNEYTITKWMYYTINKYYFLKNKINRN